ncbi:hypothetical protein PLICRDRAFT_52927 [Plicaturopsis crispa FD-325 SS-3]|nr:hypothetical protein PLICRDRAFT_52927 [Plicaturopsis crispa FD-325 SS-3]
MSEHFQAIPKEDLPGVGVLLFFALASTLGLLFVALRVAWLAFGALLRRGGSAPPSRELIFFHTQLGVYLASLLASNLLVSLAGLTAFKWVADMGITEGVACDVQAVLMQIGSLSTAYFTIVTAVHTFTSLVLRTRQTVWVGATVATFGWILSLLAGFLPLVIPGASGPRYGNSGFACGVRRVYPVLQFAFHLLPIFVAAAVSAVLYSLIFLVLRGTLTFEGGFAINLNPHQRWSGRIGTYEEYHRFMGAIARSMLWYPFAYIILLLPYSIERLMDLSGFTVTFRTTVFAYSCSFVLGLVNVLLLYNTFRVLGPAVGALPSTRQNTDVEASFHDSEKGPSYRSERRFTVASDKSLPVAPAAAVAPQYRYPSATPAVPRYISHERSASGSSGSTSSSSGSLGLLIPQGAKPGYADSVRSSVSAASIQRSITPVSELNRYFDDPAPQAAVSRDGLRPLHLGSQSSGDWSGSGVQIGLPPAPRRTRSPISRRPTLDNGVEVHSRQSSFSSVGSSQYQPAPLPRLPRSHPSLTAVSVPITYTPPTPFTTTESPSNYSANSDVALTPPPPHSAVGTRRELPTVPGVVASANRNPRRQSIQYYR